jgi:4-hydroxybenzoate adenylyltransferase
VTGRHHVELISGNLAHTLAVLAHKRGWGPTPAYLGDGAGNGAVTTYAQLFDRVRAYAAMLAGVAGAEAAGPGRRVLLALDDHRDGVAAFLAVLHVGAVAVLVSPRLPRQELADLARRTVPAAVLCEPDLTSALAGWTLMPHGDTRASVDAVAPYDCPPSHPAYIQFTSGTTGGPKPCVHTHGDPLVFQAAFGRPVLNLRPGDVTLSVSKMYFAYGLGNSIFYPLLAGATAVLETRPPTPQAIAAAIHRHGVQILFAVPSFYARMLADPAASAALASLRTVVSAGEPLPSAVERRLARPTGTAGPFVANGIGSTEVGQTFASNSPAAHRFGTVGRALPPYQICVVDEQGMPVPAGARGELQVRGPSVRPGGTPAHHLGAAERWHPTGDAAVLDPDGYLRVLGRTDDIEIVGGINVDPTEVEDLIRDHPAVADVAVCATTDASGRSRLVGFVVYTEAGAASAGTEVLAGLRGRLAAFKIPRELVAVAELPRTPNGKLRRGAVRAAAAGRQ